jgi:hypothetical protein
MIERFSTLADPCGLIRQTTCLEAGTRLAGDSQRAVRDSLRLGLVEKDEHR